MTDEYVLAHLSGAVHIVPSQRKEMKGSKTHI